MSTNYQDKAHRDTRCDYCGTKVRDLTSKNLEYVSKFDAYRCDVCTLQDPQPDPLPRIVVTLCDEDGETLKILGGFLTVEDAAAFLLSVSKPPLIQPEDIADEIYFRPPAYSRTMFPHKTLQGTFVCLPGATKGLILSILYTLQAQG